MHTGTRSADLKMVVPIACACDQLTVCSADHITNLHRNSFIGQLLVAELVYPFNPFQSTIFIWVKKCRSIAVLPFCHTQPNSIIVTTPMRRYRTVLSTRQARMLFRLHFDFTTVSRLAWNSYGLDKHVYSFTPTSLLNHQRFSLKDKILRRSSFKKMTHAQLDNRIGELYLLAKDVLV